MTKTQQQVVRPVLVRGVQARCPCGWHEQGYHPFGGTDAKPRTGLASYATQAEDARRSWQWHFDNECPLKNKRPDALPRTIGGIFGKLEVGTS